MNIRNFRDISGYKNTEGKVMEKNMIFRGGALDRITQEQANYFENTLAIRHILDFRDDIEVKLAKDYQFNHIDYEQISALRAERHNDNGFDFEKFVKNNRDVKQFKHIIEYLKEGYKTMPFDNPAYIRLFELLLKNDGNVYFHCTAGKDRTGVAGFLIMMALGMEEEDAIKEYLLSNKYLRQGGDSLSKQLNIPEEYKKMYEPLLYVQEDLIQLTISSIKEKYNNYDEFFEREYQLDWNKRNRLIEIYCK